MGLLSLKLKHSRWLLRKHGLESRFVELDNGSTIHCWVPVGDESESERVGGTKRALLLVHGFGTEATWSWDRQIAALAKDFCLYIPDLLFFGESTTSNKQRSEHFQAECMVAMMNYLGVQHAVVCGHSYGGFVAFSMAHLFPEFVTRLIILSSGIMMNPSTNDTLLCGYGATDISDVLIPRSISDTKRNLKLVFNKLPSWLPDCIFKDIFEALNHNRFKRLEILDGIVMGKEGAPPLPKLHQDVLIIWGDEDQIFKVELAHELKDFLGPKAKLVVLKGVGHLPQLEKAKHVNQLIDHFLQL